jgi:putative oxidoreductase
MTGAAHRAVFSYGPPRVGTANGLASLTARGLPRHTFVAPAACMASPPDAAGRLGREAVMTNEITDAVILVARLLLAALFLIFGWRKLVDFSGTVSRMVQDGAPVPVLSAVIAIFMELPVALAVAIGAFTRPAAALLALYTLGTALIAHHYWTVTGANKVDNMESFYKNLSIVGGFLLLYVSGAGKYSIDAMFGL